MTIALGYMLQIIPHSFDETIGKDRVKTKLSEVISTYEAFG